MGGDTVGIVVYSFSFTRACKIKARESGDLTIEIPVPLPSWNFLLSANHWKRKKVRDLMHKIIAAAVNDGVFDECLVMDYMATIRPSKRNKQKLKDARSAAKKKP
jgi:hypothetical protein